MCQPYGILQPQLLTEMPRSPPPPRGYETPVKRQRVRVANEPDQGRMKHWRPTKWAQLKQI